MNEAKCNVKVTRARFKTDWANIGKKVATLLLLKMLLLNVVKKTSCFTLIFFTN